MRPTGYLLKSLFCAVAVAALPQSQEISSGSSSASTTSSGAYPSSTPSNSSSSNSPTQAAFTGDAKCFDSMCIGALVNGSTVQYTLQSRGAADLGWMAMGYGTQMAGSEMVILWPNSDGSITLSQRTASGHTMPTPDSTAPFVASVQSALSAANGTNPKLVFSAPLGSGSKGLTTQDIIYAFGTVNPGSADPTAPLVQHIDFGTAQLDLGGALPDASTTQNPTNPVSLGFTSTDPYQNNGAAGGSTTIGLLPFQKVLVVHGILCAIGFLVLLPLGALVARYVRSFSVRWYTAHWIIQFAIGLPVIVVGVGLGIYGVHEAAAPHFNDDHKRWGIFIAAAYILQLVAGALVHYVKPKNAQPAWGRPMHNYLHVVLGLLIIGVSFYQVRDGFQDEWPETTGRGKVSNAANIVWWIWVVAVPVLYFGGLALLKRQFAQERGATARGKLAPTSSGEYSMLDYTYQRAPTATESRP